MAQYQTALQSKETMKIKLATKFVNEKQLGKLKQKLSFKPKNIDAFNLKYENCPLKPGFYFYKCF